MTLLWKFKNIYYNYLVALYFIFKYSLLTYQTHIIFIYQACLLFNAIQVVAPPSLPTQLQGQDGLNCVKVRNNGNAKQYFCEESECSICSIDKVPQKHIIRDRVFDKVFLFFYDRIMSTTLYFHSSSASLKQALKQNYPVI